MGAQASRFIVKKYAAQFLPRKAGFARSVGGPRFHVESVDRKGRNDAGAGDAARVRDRKEKSVFRRGLGNQEYARADRPRNFWRDHADVFGRSGLAGDGESAHKAQQGGGRGIGHENPLSGAGISQVVLPTKIFP